MPNEFKLFDRITAALSRKGVGVIPDAENTTETSKNPLRDWQEYFGVARSRSALYEMYFDMEADSPIISSALDAVSDTAVSGAEGDFEDIYSITFENENAKAAKIFDELEQRTGMKDDARELIRGFLHLGDEFSELVVQPKTMDIVRLKPLPAETMVVVPEHLYADIPTLGAYIQYDEEGQEIAKFEPWQIVHYGDMKRRTDIYGRSMLYSARRVYRQLQALMDGLVIGRLRMATQRYKHKIWVGSKTPEDAYRFARAQLALMRRKRRVDPKTGKLAMDRTPLLDEGDLAIPTGKNIDADVDILQGQSGQDRINDVEFLFKQLFAAVKTPPAYLGYEADTSGKSVIGTLDIAFARSVRSTQMVYGRGQRQIYDTQLALKGIDPKSVDYNLSMAPVATVDEMRRWQVDLLKAQIAKTLKVEAQVITDDEYLMREVLDIEEEMVKDLLKKKEEQEKKAQEDAEKIAQGQGGPFGAKNPLAQDPKQAAKDAQKPQGPNQQDDTSKRENFERRRRNKTRLTVPRSLREAVKSIKTNRGFRKHVLEFYQMSKPLVVAKGRTNGDKANRVLQESGGVK